jgi:dTDP-4-dehydrorhamnose reductase
MKTYDFSKVLTTGVHGMIGSYVDFGIRTDSKKLNILDREAVMRFVRKHKPRAIIHLAGATDMERCEREPEYAFTLNTVGTYNIACAARDVGAVLVYVSTSRVFNGEKKSPYTEKDVADPRTNYGHSKYLGEIVAATIAEKHIIVRTCWVFGGGPSRDNKFYGNVLRQLDNSQITAIDDMWGSPTFGKDLVETIRQLLAKGSNGTFHVANSGPATRADIARAMTHHLKPQVKVRSVHRTHFKSTKALPKNEAIASQFLHLRPWRAALAEYLDDEWKPYLLSKKIIA